MSYDAERVDVISTRHGTVVAYCTECGEAMCEERTPSLRMIIRAAVQHLCRE